MTVLHQLVYLLDTGYFVAFHESLRLLRLLERDRNESTHHGKRPPGYEGSYLNQIGCGPG